MKKIHPRVYKNISKVTNKSNDEFEKFTGKFVYNACRNEINKNDIVFVSFREQKIVFR